MRKAAIYIQICQQLDYPNPSKTWLVTKPKYLSNKSEQIFMTLG